MKYEMVSVLSALCLAIGYPTSAVADACNDAPAAGCASGTGSEHSEHSGYACTGSGINESTEDFDDVRTVDKKWDTGQVNCSCNPATATYQQTKTHVNTNKANISGSYTLSVSATAGANLAGLCKAEASATATWNAGVGWGTEAQDSEQLTTAYGFTASKCSEWHYNDWYWKGTVDGTADLHLYWSDSEQCWYNQYLIGHYGQQDLPDAITAYGHGLKDYDGSYAPHGKGFQNWGVRCTKCNPITECYKYECPEDCGSCP